MTPSHGTSLVRSCSNSASSAVSPAATSLAASDDEGHGNGRSTPQEGNRTDVKSMVGSDDEAPKESKHWDEDGSDIIVPDSNDEASWYAGSDMGGSASQGCHCFSESEDEVPSHTTVHTKKTLKNATTKEAKTDTPRSSQPASDADKVSEVKLRSQWCKDAQLMDKDFGTWCD